MIGCSLNLRHSVLGLLCFLLAASAVASQKPPAVAPQPPELPGPGVRPADDPTDEDLRRQLLLVPEVALDSVPGTSLSLLVLSRQSGAVTNVLTALASQRADLAGMPFRLGPECLLGKEPAENLQVLARKLRTCVEASIPKDGVDVRPDAARLRALLLNDSNGEWLKPEVIPALLQLLQGENSASRLVLVQLLASIEDRRSTQALAMRAVVDLSPQVRQAALRALEDRPVVDYEDVFLAGLRYPWLPVAEHAADALGRLRCHHVVPTLVNLLDEPDPRAPFYVKDPVKVKESSRKERPVVRELVRINHLGNCLLCHPPSFERTDLVRGAVPLPGERLPAPVTTPQYYDRGSRFVRADVTFLRQDFSVMQPVANPGAWPAYQRYDYLVRLRTPTLQELRAWDQREDKTEYPQRQAVLRSLRSITGKDLGTTSKEWRVLLPKRVELKSGPADAAKLAGELPWAGEERREEILDQLREGPGSTFTQALAAAIPNLEGDARKQAREVLADRLSNMKAATLRAYLRYEDPEIRRAAALACAMKDDRSHIPDMIPLLEDKEVLVVRAAHAALKSLTEQDFGPQPDATLADLKKAAEAWREWWQKQPGK